ncbi:MAG: amidohydrolase family protein [Desulfobacterales bacterium]|nr:MAG: amidohydrolase family protein [Desulfobacterales bacterium]
MDNVSKIRGKQPGASFAEVRFSRDGIDSIRADDGSRAGILSAKNERMIAPGFIDLQVNGFAGIDFNHPDFRADDLVPACEAILQTGVTRFCPTLVTGSYRRLSKNIKEILRAREKNTLVRSMVLGIHLEGPFLSPEDGPRGAHAKGHISDPDWSEFYGLYELSDGQVRMVTVAPERVGGIEFIQKATELGLVVCIGHCSPEPQIVDAAVDAGAVLSTHLGNGAHNMLPRHANYVQKQMAHDGLMASIICDGHHLPDYFVKNLVRAKKKSKTILVTDATAAAASPPGLYTIGELDIEAGEDGILRLPGTPYLAGSTLTMNNAVINCARFAGITLATAINMATVNPAKLFDDISGKLEAGQRADLVLFRVIKQRIQIEEVYLAGRRVYVRTIR